MVALEKAAEQSKNKMYNDTLDGVSAYVQQPVCDPPVQLTDQHDANTENHTQLPYNAHFNDILTEYPAWSTNTNDIENTNEAQYRSNRQHILTAWQKDTQVNMPDNRQVLDNLEAYVRDKRNITKSSNNRLGLTESSLPGTQSVTVAMVQSDQLTTNIPNNSPNSTEIGQQDDYDYQDDREEYLYQVDGTMDLHTPTDHSADDDDTEPDNNAHKRQRKTYTPADTIRKDLTKQRQAQLFKNQQEKERAKAQTLENRDKIDKTYKNKTNRFTAQLGDNRDNIDDSNNPRTQKSKGKASHPDQVKNSKKGKRTPRAHDNARVPNDPPLDPDTQDEDILISDEYIAEDDSKYTVGPDEIGFYTFFLEGHGNPPDLMGIEDDQLLAIQNDLHED